MFPRAPAPLKRERHSRVEHLSDHAPQGMPLLARVLMLVLCSVVQHYSTSASRPEAFHHLATKAVACQKRVSAA